MQNKFLEINKFSYLHNNKNIFFCKTDHILDAFQYIKKIDNEIIFITGNSDYCITDDIIDHMPKNITRWFCQNRLSDNPILKSIPIGLENTIECKVPDHGYVWPHALEKPSMLFQNTRSNPDKSIYSNFNINTNIKHRSLIKNICQTASHITWQEYGTSYSQFISGILEHKAVVCPQGNGLGDNHRIYETLYLKRVPITFNPIQYKYLHRLFPVLLLENEHDLYDKSIESKINQLFIEAQYDNPFLDIDTWIDLINKQ
jgi:hypothetical protein